MTNLEKHSVIKPASLDSANYFSSLLSQASAQNLISDLQTEKLQADCLSLLTYITRRYTGFDSSSVRIETAQNLLDSALFTVGTALKAYPDPDDALSALLSLGVSSVYNSGRRRITRLLSQSRALHKALLSNLFQTPNEFYSATILGGISGFFRLYRPDYAAHEIHITADYPVLTPQPPLLGVEFILRYLQCLSFENAFLNLFDSALAHRLLLSYDRHYAQLPINLCEPVLCAALGCALLSQPPLQLHLSFDDIGRLNALFYRKSKTEIELLLNSALVELSTAFSLPAPLSAYLRSALPQIALRAQNAAAHGSLEGLFPIT